MKFRLFLFSFLIFISSLVRAQLTGQVIDEKTKEPIAGASVYMNNSSCGTTTDEQGKFILSCKINGKAELVFSFVLYDKKVLVVEANRAEPIIVSLKPQENVLNQVVIRSKKYSIADAVKWIDLFTRNLIGTYSHSVFGCKIKNTEVLYFDFDKTNNVVSVFASAPLKIENEYLAYNIKLELDTFQYNFNTNEVNYRYSSFYESKKNTKLTSKELSAHRMEAYEGSSLHFMRSVFRNNLEAQNFAIAKYIAIRNKERDRVSAIINKRIAESYAKEERPSTSLIRFFLLDTVKYYQSVLKQDPIKSFKTSPVSLKTLIQKDRLTRTVNLNFPDTILVTYDKTKAKVSENLPISKDKENLKPIKPFYLSSYLSFYNDGGINIQLNGYYSESSLFMAGDMADRRLGMALPLDFEEENPLN